MNRITGGFLVCALVGTTAAPTSHATERTPEAVTGPAIHLEDVERFFQVYDATGGRPSAEQLQRDYLDPGTEGLHQLAKVRNVTGARIADTLTKRPEIYAEAKQCMTVLPPVR